MDEATVIIPEWESAIHQVFFDTILSGVKTMKASELWRRDYTVWMLSFALLPKALFLFSFGKLNTFSVSRVNIGAAIIQETIRNSSAGKFYDFRNITTYLKLYIKSIAVFVNVRRIKNEVAELKAVGGDSAYVTYSIIGQLINDCVFVIQQDLVGLTKFDITFLSAAGAHRWLKVDESCRKNTQPFLDQGFQKHKIFMNPDKQEDWMVDYQLNTVYLYLHDFFDSPGVYGGNVFIDHMQWVRFLINSTRRYGCNLILKAHPNEIPRSRKITDELCQKYNVRVVRNSIDLEQIRASNGLLVTVFGTVCSEAYFARVPVLACGEGPFNDLPNVIKTRNPKEVDARVRQHSKGELRLPQYQIITNDSVAEQKTTIHATSFNYGFRVPFTDCWRADWKQFMGDEPYINDSVLRKSRLRNMSELEMKRLKKFYSTSPKFEELKSHLRKELGV